jgi:hypothetical protein
MADHFYIIVEYGLRYSYYCFYCHHYSEVLYIRNIYDDFVTCLPFLKAVGIRVPHKNTLTIEIQICDINLLKFQFIYHFVMFVWCTVFTKGSVVG